MPGAESEHQPGSRGWSEPQVTKICPARSTSYFMPLLLPIRGQGFHYQIPKMALGQSGGSTSLAEAGGARRATTAPMSHPKAGPSNATNPPTSFEQHMPWTLTGKMKCSKGRGVILSLTTSGTSDGLEIHIKQTNSFCRSGKATKGPI